MRRRLLNLGLSTALLIAACLPILIHNWRAIEGYYVLNHAVGEEKYVRAALLGIKDLQGYLWQGSMQTGARQRRLHRSSAPGATTKL